uniref:Uncharacterized protein n=1 Tax=Mycena chlorophos TaxID=658473 RepID=A0ABQ0LNS9_MYCCL|nr:predicted protein [Mycena chlorophos]
MTSPARPRVPTLRSQASASRLSLAGNGSRSSLHLPLPNGNGKQKEKSVWEEMGLDGLRVPMPSFVSSPGHGVSSSALPLDGGAPPRQRTMSGVYMLGLGAGSPGRAGAGGARRPSGFGLGLGLPVGNAGGNGMKTEVEEVE